MKRTKSFAMATAMLSFLLSIPMFMLNSCDENPSDVSISVSVAEEPNATNSKTLFVETGGRKIAYRTIGKGELTWPTTQATVTALFQKGLQQPGEFELNLGKLLGPEPN